MKIEKLNEDKIRITLDIEDLREKNIDYLSFMSNSIESQKIFLDMLDQAEEEIGFVTQNYKIMIEALATLEGNFILTVTRTLPEENKKKKLNIKRKNIQLKKKQAIYSFACFDDFCHFCLYTKHCIEKHLSKLSKNFSLYFYHNTYYLVINDINLESDYLKFFYSTITEFGKFVDDSELFERKLIEYGKLVMKNNAIKTCLKHFSNKLK